jgi:ADP-ribosylglycohydrolase
MTFSISPIGGAFPPVTTEDFPNFIQFQFNGVNLGGPDADTVNFVGAGIIAVRGGSGVDPNTITVVLG